MGLYTSVLFIKYVSDKYEDDEDTLITVPEGASFKMKGKTGIVEYINKKTLAPIDGIMGAIKEQKFF